MLPRRLRGPLTGLLLLPVLAGAAAAPAAATGGRSSSAAAANVTKAHHAAGWQAGQLVNGHMPGFQPGQPDWGLTIDVEFMLAADGKQAQASSAVQRAISKHWRDYAVRQGHTYSGSASKALLAAVVAGADPTHFGGQNVRKLVVGLIAPASAGFEAGRLRDAGGADLSNAFGQAYGTLGLARSGAVPQSVVDYLVKQRCSAGYFRIVETAGKTCDETGDGPDVDTTALALQALLAAKADGANVAQGTIDGSAAWLASAQLGDGSYSADGSADAPNANTTGLAANALAATGFRSAQKAAAHWVASLQITKVDAGHGPARPDVGAIGFDPAALADALKNGLGDNRSQWWRVGPQAYFALAPHPLSTLAST